MFQSTAITVALIPLFAAAAVARDVDEGGAVDRTTVRAVARLHEIGATLVLRSGKAYDPKQAMLVGPADVRKVEFPRQRRVVTSAGETWEPVENQHLAPLRSLSGVEEVTIRNSRVTDAGLAYLAHLKTLRALDVSQGAVTDAALPALAELTGLERLNLSGNRLARPDWSALARLEHLAEMDLSGNQLGDEALAGLDALKRLRRLDLKKTGLSDAALRHLAALKHIESLDLSDNGLTGRGLDALVNGGKLQTLDLAGSPVGREALPILMRLSRGNRPLTLDGRYIAVADVLRETRAPIVGLQACNDHDRWRDGRPRADVHLWSENRRFEIVGDCTEEDLQALGRHASIESIEIRRMPVSDAGLAALAKLPKLGKLEIATTGALSDKSVRLLGGLSALETLHLSGIELRSDSLKLLADLPRLRAVTLADGRVKGSNLAHLGRSTTVTSLCLKDLDIDGPGFEQLAALRQLERLEAVGSDLSDRDFVSIGRMKALKSLNLSHSSTSDAGLKHLIGLTRLSSLHLERTAVTADGLRHLGKFRGLYLDCTASDVGDDAAQTLADDFGWTFYGGCPCGCLDITPRNAGK